MGWKEDFREEKTKMQEKERIKQEKKEAERAQMSTSDKVAKEAWGTAKTYMAVRYLPHMVLFLIFGVIFAWFLADMAWSWFVGLF